MFFTKFLSYCRKERKGLRKVFLFYMVNASEQQGTRENANDLQMAPE